MVLLVKEAGLLVTAGTLCLRHATPYSTIEKTLFVYSLNSYLYLISTVELWFFLEQNHCESDRKKESKSYEQKGLHTLVPAIECRLLALHRLNETFL